MFVLLLLALLMPDLVMAGTITRPVKSNSLTSFTNGMIPTAGDLNSDPDTIYAEFNGNITNANISASAAIAASKVDFSAGLTTNVRTVATAPCTILEESDQSADAKRWAMCLISGELRISTHSDAGATQNDWLKINRANGGTTIGGSGGTNTINGPTTFTHLVTFNGGNNLMPTGAITAYLGAAAPSGWLLLNGSSQSCTGSASVNAALCAMLVASGSPTWKGAAAATITVDTSSNEIIHTAHGHTTGDRVHFGSTTSLPSPLVSTTLYCIISTSTDRFKISTTCGGGEVDITTSGSGTRSDYFNMVLPETRGRTILGAGSGPGLTPRVIGTTGGEEQHLLTIGEMPSHTHSYTAPNSPGFNSAGGGQPIVSGVSGTTTGAAGGGAAHDVMDPFMVMSWIIKL